MSSPGLLMSPGLSVCSSPRRCGPVERAHLVAVDLPRFGHAEGRAALSTSWAMGEFVIDRRLHDSKLDLVGARPLHLGGRATYT